jgi:hypothetical protein
MGKNYVVMFNGKDSYLSQLAVFFKIHLKMSIKQPRLYYLICYTVIACCHMDSCILFSYLLLIRNNMSVIYRVIEKDGRGLKPL